MRPAARRAVREHLALRDLPYLPTGRMEHTLDLWRPREAKGPLPVTLYVHGGGFSILSKETHWAMALAFARHGQLVFNANYRLAPRDPYPAALEDVCAAFLYVVRHAAEHGGDPARITLAGESAGANLVLALAVAACYPRPEPYARAVFECGVRPAAVVAGCGLLQASDPERFAARKRLPSWLSDRIEETSRAYLDHARPDPTGGLGLADPLKLLELEPPARPLPPIFAFAGTRDPILDDTRRLGAALDRLGSPHLVRYYPGELHAFHAFSWREQARRCWDETFDFLRAHVP